MAGLYGDFRDAIVSLDGGTTKYRLSNAVSVGIMRVWQLTPSASFSAIGKGAAIVMGCAKSYITVLLQGVGLLPLSCAPGQAVALWLCEDKHTSDASPWWFGTGVLSEWEQGYDWENQAAVWRWVCSVPSLARTNEPTGINEVDTPRLESVEGAACQVNGAQLGSVVKVNIQMGRRPMWIVARDEVTWVCSPLGGAANVVLEADSINDADSLLGRCKIGLTRGATKLVEVANWVPQTMSYTATRGRRCRYAARLIFDETDSAGNYTGQVTVNGVRVYG